VVIIYVEAISQLAKFRPPAAWRAAKSIVAVSSASRRRAQRRHGAYRLARGQRRGLRRSRARWASSAPTPSTTRLRSPSCSCTRRPAGRQLGAVTSPARIAAFSSVGGRNGLEFPALAPATTERLNAVLTVGSLVESDRRRLWV
jgi:hypothetical protein